MSSTELPNITKWLMSGAAAGLSVDLALYPLDTIKTRIQSQQGFLKAGGFRGIYNGMSSVALGSAPGSAMFFVTYLSMKDLVEHQTPLWDAFRASCGEVSACIVRVPTEVVKQRAQVSARSTLHIFRDILRTDGFAGFFRGYFPTLLREIPFAFIEYPLWEYFKMRIKQRQQRDPLPWQSALCGSAAGSIAAGITTPLDVAKTRIMLGSTKSTNTYKVMVETYQTEGFRSLFAGLTPRCIWMGVGGLIYFFSYEYSMHLLSFNLLR